MATDYNYTISGDFGNDPANLDSSTLHKSIDADAGITPTLNGITVDGDDVVINFASALSAGEQTTLNGIVSSHVPVPPDTSFLYQAIVDKNETGDYTSISAAIAAGKNTIYVRSGVYVETSDLNLPNNFHLTGEDKSSTIIHFNNTNSSVVVDGGAAIETAGTISITTDTTAVTGSGTTFTNLSANDYIRIGDAFHQIDSITDNTNLVLKDAYRGPTKTSINYKATTFKTGSISNISIAYSTGSLLKINKCINVSIHNIGLGMGNKGIYAIDSAQFIVHSSVTYNCTKSIHVSNSEMFGLSNVLIKNNVEEGVYLDNCKNLLIDSLYIFDSGTDGLKIANGGENIQLTETIANNNKGDGINSNSSGNIIIQTCITDGNSGSGIVSTGTGFDTMDGCIASDNGSYGYKLSNNTSVSSCIARDNANGIQMANDCAIASCIVNGNTTDGIKFATAKNDCIISTCHICDNGGTGIDILGTDNIVSLNVVKNNTTAQITDGGTGTINVNNKT